MALALGVVMIWMSAQFARTRSTANARRLFVFSLAYLSVLWIALVADRVW